MPIYEFHCEACSADSEILVRSTEWKGTRCPKCGSTRLEKKLSVFASSMAGGASAGAAGGGAADCSGTPSSCMRCCGGGPHRH
jgi:putative FmdB family regulatory protein